MGRHAAQEGRARISKELGAILFVARGSPAPAPAGSAATLPEKVPSLPDAIEPERNDALNAEADCCAHQAVPISQCGFIKRVLPRGNCTDRSLVRGKGSGGKHIPEQKRLRRLDIGLVQSLTWHVHSFLSILPMRQNSETSESGDSKNQLPKLRTIYSLMG